MRNRQSAVVLLSGGIDSATMLALAIHQGFDCFALTFKYGQRHAVEVEAARRIAKSLNVKRHLVLKLDLRKIGGSALTANISVPKQRSFEEIMSTVPVTYVPGRNIIFLACALSWAEVLGSRNIFLGVVAGGGEYPDGTPRFLKHFERMANVGTKAGLARTKFHIHAPLIASKKEEIIRLGLKLGVDFALTHSCFDPDDGLACGECDACKIRLRGFRKAGLNDPASA